MPNPGGGVEVWVRLDRPLRDNEGVLGEYPGSEAEIEVPGTVRDIPGLYRDDLHPTCYGQWFDGDIAEGAQVEVALVLGRGERLTATVQAHKPDDPARAGAQALRALGCPSDRGATRRCHGSVGGRYYEIGVQSATNDSCRSARAVMRSVGRWASSRCYQTLCVRKHRINRGYRCSVDLTGEAAWQITCTRGRRIVRGNTAD